MATHGLSSQPILDWKLIFHEDQNVATLLQYHASLKTNGRIVEKPTVQEGIAKWFTNLVGQLLEKPLPFLLVKKSVQGLWRLFGWVEVFSLDNGLFHLKFDDLKSRDAVLEAKGWHIANKPLILCK